MARSYREGRRQHGTQRSVHVLLRKPGRQLGHGQHHGPGHHQLDRRKHRAPPTAARPLSPTRSITTRTGSSTRPTRTPRRGNGGSLRYLKIASNSPLVPVAAPAVAPSMPPILPATSNAIGLGERPRRKWRLRNRQRTRQCPEPPHGRARRRPGWTRRRRIEQPDPEHRRRGHGIRVAERDRRKIDPLDLRGIRRDCRKTALDDARSMRYCSIWGSNNLARSCVHGLAQVRHCDSGGGAGYFFISPPQESRPPPACASCRRRTGNAPSCLPAHNKPGSSCGRNLPARSLPTNPAASPAWLAYCRRG